ncbi:hypothetical protein EC915_10724 [Pseudomonas sp. LP_7_YM]|nr:hypothetical protein EC915_10724 [Pseudomonas sp. LP_7_YM]
MVVDVDGSLANLDGIAASAGKSHLQKSGYSLEYAAFRAPMPAVHLKICSTDYRNFVQC